MDSNMPIIYPVEDAAEPGLIPYDIAELFQFSGIWRFRDPKLEVASFGIFLVKMLKCPLPMSFFLKLGIVFKAILDGSSDYGLRNYLAVGLCYYSAIDAPGPVVR